MIFSEIGRIQHHFLKSYLDDIIPLQDLLDKLQKIANQLNAELTINDQKDNLLTEINQPNPVVLIVYQNDEQKFFIKYSLGLSWSAEVTTFLSSINHYKLEIACVNHFLNLFLQKKNRFKIKTDDHILKSKIKQESSFLKLSDIAKQTSFEPNLYTYQKDDKIVIKTEYDIRYFYERTSEIIPMIEFYRFLGLHFKTK
ncbi:hypothetical protein K6119_03025 [Paracrocinitomix mangrovi]|uniref:hypothetical protein n=1 Tax=Paracrocinitomix mangrovi TaxID=2862509 RepID=UPI001C8E649F|nr:hypothetical protein [Paracrocinitomix mangrovi]UKN02493.1 hypothetical protein K6119_03025 [Paracrocinitomix mangrovi]